MIVYGQPDEYVADGYGLTDAFDPYGQQDASSGVTYAVQGLADQAYSISAILDGTAAVSDGYSGATGLEPYAEASGVGTYGDSFTLTPVVYRGMYEPAYK